MADARPILALEACLTCRRQKRKCSRELPTCVLCKRNGRSCEYRTNGRQPRPLDDSVRADARSRSPINSRPASRHTASLSASPSNTLTSSLPAQRGLPAWFFLDFHDFSQKRLFLQTPTMDLPHEFNHLLEKSSLMFDVDVYFSSVHTFLPIVSKLRLYLELSTSLNNHNADLALLLMTMQLHTKSINGEEPQNWDPYRVAKAACSHVESNNIFSIRLLQATLLIALYEIQHAIYPAAYLRVGHCARLGHAMGVHDRKRAPQMLSTPTTSTEWEERRRSWWAVIMLDRFVLVGSRDRPFACDDARPEELLPVDEKHWDQGELALVQPLAVSTNSTIQVCPFARSCQVSHVLSRVLRHVNDRDANDEFRYQEASQLHRTLQALSSAIFNESELLWENSNDAMAKLPLFTATALCYSALFSLYELYCCAETADASQVSNPSFMEMQKIGMAGLKELSYKVFQFSQSVKSVATLGGMLRMSPLVCHCLYEAAANFAWLVGETGNEQDFSKLVSIKSVLEMLGNRWKLAKEYQGILDSYEHTKFPVQ